MTESGDIRATASGIVENSTFYSYWNTLFKNELPGKIYKVTWIQLMPDSDDGGAVASNQAATRQPRGEESTHKP